MQSKLSKLQHRSYEEDTVMHHIEERNGYNRARIDYPRLLTLPLGREEQ
jgi:hypothetical protein